MHELVYVSLAILYVAVIVEGLVVLGVMRQLGAVLLTVQPGAARDVGGGPQLGTTVDLRRFDLDGSTGALFVFVSPDCQPCEELRPALAKLPREHPTISVIPVVAFGEAEARVRYAEDLGGLARADLSELSEEWDVPGTPYVITVDRSGRITAKGVVTNGEQLSTMSEVAERDHETTHEPPANEDAAKHPAVAA
jgi:hypothetical protein